jgi:perosamine synthetase
LFMVDPGIPWAKPVLWGGEEAAVLDALRTTWISGGPYVERLEADLANYLGVRHAIAVANGTAAIHLSYLALGLKAGDEIVVPAFGFLAAANVALQLGMRPVFCDVDPETWCMEAEDVAAVLTPATRAIVAVHSYGNLCDLEALLALAASRGVPLIEDAAEALGSRYAGCAAGSLGQIGTFSFQATKTITTGEGGLVVTSDDKIADMARLFRSHGLKRSRHYWHEVPGHNFRLTNLQAALGYAQFAHMDEIVAARRSVSAQYESRLRGLPGISLPRLVGLSEPLVWAIAVLLSPEAYPQGRDAVMAAMAAEGIETRPWFQPPAEMSYFDSAPMPTSEHLGRWVLSLPTFPTLTEPEIDRICLVLAQLAGGGTAE